MALATPAKVRLKKAAIAELFIRARLSCLSEEAVVENNDTKAVVGKSDTKRDATTLLAQENVSSASHPACLAETDRSESGPDELVQPAILANGTEAVHVFISYRIDPDAPLATALKRLIESAIEPQPKVFVSGDGGLRPSNAGFKQQLRAAAQSAHAFVAIITNASKDREWIFFEAGAAWGRDLIYAPILVGAAPGDLPSTIGDYQALSSESKNDMYRLMRVLAEQVGATLKDRFGLRYQSFSRTVTQYLTGKADAENGDQGNDLYTAYRLANQGDIEASNQIFDRLEEKAIDDENRCEIEVYRLQAQRKPQELPGLLSELDDVLKNTSTFNYNMAILTDRPLLRGEFLNKAIAIGKGRNAILSLLERSRLDFQVGQEHRGKESLMMIVKDRTNVYSERAAALLVDLVPDLSLIEKLLIHLAGLRGNKGTAYFKILELVRTSEWTALHLYVANQFDDLQGDGPSANERGIARTRSELPSLAFESYNAAMKSGVSVARCNMAGLIARGSAAAGLALLDEHAGPFDAADRGYPYQLRAELERALDKEREKEKEVLKRSAQQFQALWTFAEKILVIPQAEPVQVKGKVECGIHTIAFDEAGPHGTTLTQPVDVQALRLFGPNVFVFHSDGELVFLLRTVDGVETLYLDDYRSATRTLWVPFIKQ